MAQSKEEIAGRLSCLIFKKSWNNLDLDKQHFVYLQTRWYFSYRKKIAAAARTAMDSKQLNGKDYWLIYDWYMKRIPPYVVLAAVHECLQYARNNRKAIYGLNYFRKAVTRHFEKHLQLSPRRELCDGDDIDWHYNSFLLFQEGKYPSHWKFSPFDGPNPHHGVPRR